MVSVGYFSKFGLLSRLKTPSVLFDILNSFVCLARRLNLSHASEELGFTRQTIKRHIAELEAKIGRPLFELDNRKYALTEAGKIALPGAKQILLRANCWFDGMTDRTVLKHLEKVDNDSSLNFIQKHSIAQLNQSGPAILRKGFLKWVEAGGRIEHPSLLEMQPHAMNFRKQGTFWICIHIGEKSSMASWLGEADAASSAGELFEESPMTGTYSRDATEAYDYAYYTGDMVYDHISAGLPHVTDGAIDIVNYQRLVVPCLFPNNERLVTSFVFRTNDIKIDNVPESEIPKMDEKWEMVDA